jgi:hypothetical protein
MPPAHVRRSGAPEDQRYRQSAHGHSRGLLRWRAKSSCAASSCTCCRAVLCASATSASWLTGGEQNSFRFVCGCSSPLVSQQQTPPHPRCPFTRCGNVRFAAEPCELSSASPPPNSSSDLRLISSGAPHESTSPTSNLAPAPGRTLVLCLAFVGTQYDGAIQTLPCAAPRPFSLPPPTETQALSQERQTNKPSRAAHPDTNPIVPRAASFKSLYLKRHSTAPQLPTLCFGALKIQH